MKRNYGVDALRMCAMYMVVVLHVLSQGGVLQALEVQALGVNYQIAWLLEAMACCAVNCFALISGYAGAETEFRSYKGLVLWLQIVFWTLVLTAAYAVMMPETLTIRQLVKSVFPILTQQYWYVTAYFCTFLFMPFMNRLLQNLSKRELKMLAVNIVGVVSVLSTFVKSDLFSVRNGYSFLWIALLYLLGAVLKKLEFGKNIKKRVLLLIYLLSAAATWGVKIGWEKFSSDHATQNVLYSYSSITMLICAIALLLFFSRLEIKSWGIKFVKYASPLAFSVYVIHANPLVWNNWLAGRYEGLAEKTPIMLLTSVLGAAALIYMACSLLDAVRAYIFKLLKVTEWCKKLGRE